MQFSESKDRKLNISAHLPFPLLLVEKWGSLLLVVSNHTYFLTATTSDMRDAAVYFEHVEIKPQSTQTTTEVKLD